MDIQVFLKDKSHFIIRNVNCYSFKQIFEETYLYIELINGKVAYFPKDSIIAVGDLEVFL